MFIRVAHFFVDELVRSPLYEYNIAPTQGKVNPLLHQSQVTHQSLRSHQIYLWWQLTHVNDANT